MSTAAHADHNAVDSLARQFVNAEILDIKEVWRDVVQKSREAVIEQGGSRNLTHFLENLCSRPRTPNLRTLIVTVRRECEMFPPLYGVERWGRDGLLLDWEQLLEEEEEEEGSLERCMHAIGSLCRTSLRELQLYNLPISPKHLNSLSHAMHKPPPGNSSAGTYSLQCLRLQELRYKVPGAENGVSQDLQPVLFTLPPSLHFLGLDDDAARYQAPKMLLAPPVVDQVNNKSDGGLKITSPLDPAAAPLIEAGAGIQVSEAGEAAQVISSGNSWCNYTGAYTLSSLLGCPHLHLQGLIWWGQTGSSTAARQYLIHGDDDLRKAASSLAHNTCLQALSIYVRDSALLPAEWATEALKRNTSLITLHLRGFRMPQPSGFDLFFEEGVAHNHSLTQLSLSGCRGPWTVEAILDSLQDNGSLHDIDLYNTPLKQEEAAIEAQLERNKKSAEMMRSLGLNPRKVQPRAARVFLCGEPYAGKTTIVKSLSISFKSTWEKLCDKDWLLHSILRRKRPRTKGIEVTSLKRGGEKILFWDLAGQDEYRIFHDYVFPDLSSRQSPSFFLFVWSPVWPKTQQKKSGETFTKELEYWLKFITSKTRKSKKFIPNLIIAITRKDKAPNVKADLHSKINSCKQKFENLINIEFSNVFEVDSRDPSSVGPLGQCIFTMGSNILKSVKPVLELKETIRMFFEKKVSNKEVSPIITKDEYIRLCEQKVGQDSQDIVESIALLLNESGDLIYGGSHKLVVLDMRWFCHTIMGNLIHSTGPESSLLSARGLGGFFEKARLQSFFQELVLSSNSGMRDFFRSSFKRKEKMDISGEALLELLIDMNVVYEDVENSKIFLPSSLGYQEDSLPSQEERTISSQDTTIHTYGGRQLKCEDSKHTFLTPGVFPGLQVLFLNKFGPGRLELKKYYMDVNLENGVRAFVEFCASEGVEHSIDIIYKSKDRDLSYCVNLIQSELVSEIVKLCASSKGIQGVKLVESVIGPSTTITLGQKGRQAIPVKELQDVVKKDLIRNCKIDQIVYAWPYVETRAPTHPASPIQDFITNLLSIFEIQKVIEGFKTTLKELVSVINTDPILKMKADEKGELALVGEFESLDGNLKKILEEIYHEIRAVREESRHNMQIICYKLDKINDGLHDLQCEVYRRLQDMQELIKQGEQRKLPTMWLLKINREKIVAKIAPPGLHNANLQLYCEHEKKPHLPKEQIGLSFSYLDDESFLKKALPYLKIFLKIAYIATKVGVHLISGGGDNLIPDFSEVVSIFEDWSSSATPSFLDQLKSSSDLPKEVASSSNQESRSVYQERARIWLWEFLEKNQCTKGGPIHEKFKLNCVRYKATQQIAWLCDDHTDEGVLKDKLEMLSLDR